MNKIKKYYKIKDYSVKCRLYPNKDQSKKIDRAIHAVHVAHNTIMHEMFTELKYTKEHIDSETGETVHFPDFYDIGKSKNLKVLKEKYPIIKEVPAYALSGNNGVINDMKKRLVSQTENNPSKNSRPVETMKPCYYTKSKPRKSYTYQMPLKMLNYKSNKVIKVQLSKIGEVTVRGFNTNLRFDENHTMTFEDYIKLNPTKQVTVTVSKDSCGDYWIIFKLNNVDTLSSKFYAPTTGGTNGYYLKSNGETVPPTWEVFPTIPTIKLNNADTLSPKFYAPITGGTNGYYLKSNGENNVPTWEIFPEIPNIGSLNTTSSSSISTSSRESFSQDINLHKISKTGSYNDLLNKPIISSVGSEEGPVILASLADGTYSISGSYKNNASSVDIIETTSPILVNKAGDNLTMISGAKTQVNYNTLNESIWTTKTSNLVQASSFDSIEIVTDFPTTMKQNVLYMRIEGV